MTDISNALQHNKKRIRDRWLFPGPAFYGVLSCIAFMDAFWVILGHIELKASPALLYSFLFVALEAVAWRWAGPRICAGFHPDRREEGLRLIATLSAFFESLLAIYLMIAVNVFEYLMANIVRLPYRDSWLAMADARLDLDWHGYFAFVTASPALRLLYVPVYNALWPACVTGLIALILTGRLERARYMLHAILAAALVCIGISAFFPAMDAAVYLWKDPGFKLPPAFLRHMAPLGMLRGGGPVTLRLGDMPGLISFPSYHAAAGIILACCFRRTAWFWPVLAYALMMIATAPVMGGHYFVDLIGGAAVAGVVLGFMKLKIKGIRVV